LARSLVGRASYLTWKLSGPSEQLRARRLRRRALKLLGSQPVDDAELARLCARRTRLVAAPPVRAFVAWLLDQPRRRRLGLAFGLALVLGLGAAWRWRLPLGLTPNLALGRPWHTDSALGLPSQGLIAPATPVVFFHTNYDPSPSIVVDLGHQATFSRLRILNREDCCPSRALPLVVEVSDDERSWLPVLEHRLPFAELLETVPTTTARFLRVRVKRLSCLHLREIGIYRW
jgi:hypothetical protein